MKIHLKCATCHFTNLVIEQKEIEIDDLKKMIPAKPTKTDELNANPNANGSEANPNASESVSKPRAIAF